MMSIYGEIPDKIVKENETDLIGQIYKLLIFRENSDECLDYHFKIVLFRITGMSNLFIQHPQWLTIISLLEAARNEDDFKLYRKAVLDSCSIVKTLKDEIDTNA